MAKKHLKLAIRILVIIFLIIFLIFRGRIYFWKAANRFDNYVQTKQNEQVLEEIKEAEQRTKVERRSETQTEAPTQTNPETHINPETEIPPRSKLLKVPFICQAPLQTVENWKFHEESCEEAAVLQAYLYETGTTMTKQVANDEILKMIEWEKTNFGGHKDLYAEAVKAFIVGYYQIEESQVNIIYDATLEDIKKIVNQGHPVIVPIMGDILKNPNYPYPGYHMLIVTGFTDDMIITNDNGTRKGESYSYSNERFLEAMKAAGGDIVILDLQ